MPIRLVTSTTNLGKLYTQVEIDKAVKEAYENSALIIEKTEIYTIDSTRRALNRGAEAIRKRKEK
jgi:hypothetical protein